LKEPVETPLVLGASTVFVSQGKFHSAFNRFSIHNNMRNRMRHLRRQT
jgi:hypothetical protein